MRVMQADLLRMAIEPSKFLSPSKATKTISDIEANVLGPMETREELRLALDASRAAVEAYNTQSKVRVDSEHELMGSRVSAAVAPFPCYDEWVLTYLTDAPAQETDAAMTDLKTALANDNDVARVLGCKHKETELSVVFGFDKVSRLLDLPSCKSGSTSWQTPWHFSPASQSSTLEGSCWKSGRQSLQS